MAGTELDRLYYTIDADLAPYNAKMRGLSDTAQQAGGTIKKHLEDAGGGAEKLHRGIEVSRRELLYFGREIATGDMARIPSTLVLIGSHLAGITSEAIIMGAAIIGPFALMATSAVQAEKAFDRVALSIAATGSAAGMTKGQMIDLAYGLDKTSNLSNRGALDTLSILGAHGNIRGGANLSMAGQASDAYSKISGLGVDKSADAIEKMLANPGKAAEELQQQFKLLTNQQVEHIQKLQEEGHYADAQEELSKALIARGKDVEDSMWSMSKAFDGFTKKLSDWWFNTGAMFAGGSQGTGQRYQQAMTEAGRMQWALGQHARGITPGMVQGAWQNAGNLHYQDRLEQKRASDAQAQADKDQQERTSRDPAHLELMRYGDEARVAGASPRNRNMMRARLDARRGYLSNLNNPESAGLAGGIESAQVGAAQAQQNATRKENLTLANQAADAEEKLASAQRIGALAASQQNNTNKAHTEWLKGAIDNEAAYAAALNRSTQAQLLTNSSKQGAKEAGAVESLRLENSLMGINSDVRARELAELKTKNELIDEGVDLTTKAGQEELRSRLQITDAMQQQLQLQRDLNTEQQNELTTANELVDIFGRVLSDPKNAVKSLEKDLTAEILKLGVINPLKNAVTGAVTGKPGELPTFANLLGGGPKPDGTVNNPIHVVIVKDMSSGGVGGADGGGGIISMMSAVARGEIGRAIPGLNSSAIDAFSQAISRGFNPGSNTV